MDRNARHLKRAALHRLNGAPRETRARHLESVQPDVERGISEGNARSQVGKWPAAHDPDHHARSLLHLLEQFQTPGRDINASRICPVLHEDAVKCDYEQQDVV
jgi:hypothetical protein